MKLNPVMEKFYTGILNYAGMELSENIFVNKNSKLGEISIEGKHLTLPYFENLKHPDGKIIFHLLNENYTNPENSVFDLYQRRLTLELNLKLSSLIISLISVASDVQMQQRIKSSKLIELISSIGEVDHTLIEAFLGLVKASKKEKGESFLFDFHLKKGGYVDDIPHAAIGKTNHHVYAEIGKALEEKEREYRVYNHKLRKKDLIALYNIFNVIFPDINTKQDYTEGTDNKIFRYLNILLKTSYHVASLINEKAKLLEELNEPSLNVEDIYSDLSWADQLEALYELKDEIYLIPNQTDVSLENTHLKVNESKAAQVNPQSQRAAPVYDPNRNQPVTQNQPVPQVQQPMQIQQPRTLTPEEIIRGMMGQQPMQQPMMTPPMMQPMIPMPMQPAPVNQGYTPTWIQQEMVRNGQQPPMNMQQPMMQQPVMMQQPMMNPQMIQPMMMQPNTQQMPMMMQPGMQQPMLMQQPMQQSSLQVNPHFMGGRSSAPWN